LLRLVMHTVNSRISFPYRHARLTHRLAPLLADVTTALDVGAGDGLLSSQLIEMTGCPISGIDVHLQPHPHIHIRHYDGHTLPYPENAFDGVLMVDMLHHTIDIGRMLSEARRVARRFVIIKDHYWDTRRDLAALRAADYVGNIPYGVALPYNYLRLDEWAEMFRLHGLTEIERATFKIHRLEPGKHIMVKLGIERTAAHLAGD
jgi:2-polyprenyl-3-methyl-5-hydroxy-6-metoxy-1,4-benzoquinol methylase